MTLIGISDGGAIRKFKPAFLSRLFLAIGKVFRSFIYLKSENGGNRYGNI